MLGSPTIMGVGALEFERDGPCGSAKTDSRNADAERMVASDAS